MAASSYAAAADLTLADPRHATEASAGQQSAGMLWQRAAEAADTNADWARAIHLAGRARDYYLDAGQARTAARAQAIAGRALFHWGRLAEAHEQLTAALKVLRTDPDTDTVRALTSLALAEIDAGSPDADRLSGEALSLGQALAIGDRELSPLFGTRGNYFQSTNWFPEAAAYYRESVRLADQAGDNDRLGRALVSLGDILTGTDPAKAAETSRAAAGHLRRVGARELLAVTIFNLAQALVMLGDWDAAEAELTSAIDSDGLADIEFLTCQRGWLAALRGDVTAAQAELAGLQDLRASENLQDKALISMTESFTAAACRKPQDALRYARATLANADALGISYDCLRWAWPLAARAAHDLRDAATVGELLTLLDSYAPGHLAPMLRAERDLARARPAASDDAPTRAAFAAAIGSLRELSTPYHLAHGLLDYADFLTRSGDVETAAAAIGEAREIAQRLRSQPLLDRAGTIQAAKPAAQAG